MKIEIDVEIGVCDDCYFRGIDGGPSPAMVCNHSDAKSNNHHILQSLHLFKFSCFLLFIT